MRKNECQREQENKKTKEQRRTSNRSDKRVTVTTQPDLTLCPFFLSQYVIRITHNSNEAYLCNPDGVFSFSSLPVSVCLPTLLSFLPLSPIRHRHALFAFDASLSEKKSTEDNIPPSTTTHSSPLLLVLGFVLDHGQHFHDNASWPSYGSRRETPPFSS